jgi:hypothetical protein
MQIDSIYTYYISSFYIGNLRVVDVRMVISFWNLAARKELSFLILFLLFLIFLHLFFFTDFEFLFLYLFL